MLSFAPSAPSLARGAFATAAATLLTLSASCLAQAPQAATALPAPPAWDKLRAAYDYQPATPDPEFFSERVSLLDAAGKSVPGLLLRPKARGIYPVVLLLHGLGSDKETMVRLFGRALAARGFACLALDARDHGERVPPGERLDVGAVLAAGAAPKADPKPGEQGAQAAAAPASSASLRFGLAIKGTVDDYRRALDYLQTRDDIDSARVGLLGYSMGSMMGAILAGVDERIKATVLEVGGDPIRPLAASVPAPLRESVEAISPSNYVGHIAPRALLLINAKSDQIMSADAARRLQEAAREPKQIIWAEGGHILAAPDAMRGVEWLSEKLGAPAPQK